MVVVWSAANTSIPRYKELACTMSDIIPQKVCSKCGKPFPATLQYFHAHNGGLRPDCKVCRLAHVKAYYEQPETHEQRAAYSKEYRQKNQEQVKAKKKAYYSTPEAQEIKRNYTRAYRQRPDARERKRASDHEYNTRPEVRAARRPKDRILSSTRRARKRGNGGQHTHAQLQEQLLRQKGKCYYCQIKLGNDWQAEHLVPIARGGSNDISNIVIACSHCNAKKWARLPHEFPEGGHLL